MVTECRGDEMTFCLEFFVVTRCRGDEVSFFFGDEVSLVTECRGDELSLVSKSRVARRYIRKRRNLRWNNPGGKRQDQ